MRELEANLPSITGTSTQNSRDCLQALLDNGSVKMEKMGSGHWYWSFLSETRQKWETTSRGWQDLRKETWHHVESLRLKLGATGIVADEHEIGDAYDHNGMLRSQMKLVVQVDGLRSRLVSYDDPLWARSACEHWAVIHDYDMDNLWARNITVLDLWLREVLKALRHHVLPSLGASFEAFDSPHLSRV